MSDMLACAYEQGYEEAFEFYKIAGGPGSGVAGKNTAPIGMAYLELEKLGGAFEDLAINASRKVIKREVKHSMRDGETPSTRELRPVERYRSEDKRGNPSSGATLLR